MRLGLTSWHDIRVEKENTHHFHTTSRWKEWCVSGISWYVSVVCGMYGFRGQCFVCVWYVCAFRVVCFTFAAVSKVFLQCVLRVLSATC